MDINYIDEVLSYNFFFCDVVKVDLKIFISDLGKVDNINFNLLNLGELVIF